MSASAKRDYYMSTISVIQSQRKLIEDLLYSIDVRLEELEDTLAHDMDAAAVCKQDNLVEYAWNEGYEYANFEHNKIIWNDEENDDIIYDSARNKKPECMCDECWGVKSDAYEHRMD